MEGPAATADISVSGFAGGALGEGFTDKGWSSGFLRAASLTLLGGELLSACSSFAELVSTGFRAVVRSPTDDENAGVGSSTTFVFWTCTFGSEDLPAMVSVFSGWYGVVFEALSNCFVVEWCWSFDLGGERESKLSTLRILKEEPDDGPEGLPGGLDAKLLGDTKLLLALVLLLLLLLVLLLLLLLHERVFLE